MASANTLAARGLERIRDVILKSADVVVRAKCNCCGCVWNIDWIALAVGLSEEKSLWTLARRIRCKVCSSRGCVWLVSDYRAPAEPDASDSQRSWTAGNSLLLDAMSSSPRPIKPA
jgi:hypothetical protein